MKTLLTILRDNWEWRGQIGNLAVFDLKKRARGAVLGWTWLLVKPLIFILVFWFALAIGLRARSAMGDVDYPYFLWLVSGVVPWFFMSDMISTGSDVYHRYPYLVNKVRFPLSAISTIFTLSTMVICLMLMVVVVAVYIYSGMPWDVYLLQVPLVLLLMFVYWDLFSIATSQISGFSRDFSHFMKALAQPFFWFSGIIFSLDLLADGPFGWVSTVMAFNPVSFFATAMRDAICDKVWIWEDPLFFGGFVVVFVGTAVFACLSYRRFHEEVADAL